MEAVFGAVSLLSLFLKCNSILKSKKEILHIIDCTSKSQTLITALS